jgi:hypothetical protein
VVEELMRSGTEAAAGLDQHRVDPAHPAIALMTISANAAIVTMTILDSSPIRGRCLTVGVRWAG